jgi:hypothetical protein
MKKPPVSEREFMSQVVQLAKHCGWRVYHTHDSRRSEAGFPDLVLVRRSTCECVHAELKSDRGKPTAEQAAWLADLRLAGLRVYLWRPADWPEIERVLGPGRVKG